jgi:hypothetical protein
LSTDDCKLEDVTNRLDFIYDQNFKVTSEYFVVYTRPDVLTEVSLPVVHCYALSPNYSQHFCYNENVLPVKYGDGLVFPYGYSARQIEDALCTFTQSDDVTLYFPVVSSSCLSDESLSLLSIDNSKCIKSVVADEISAISKHCLILPAGSLIITIQSR